MRILNLFLRYGNETYPDAERDMNAVFARRMPGVERKTIIIDNALPPHFVERHRERFVIGGDNSFGEFSAWGKAIELLGAEIWDYDLVHLATSAFNTLYVKYLERFTPEMLAAISRRPVCLGHIDCYNEPVQLLSFKSQHWIRSCFFFLPPVELKALGSLVSLRDVSSVFTGDPEQPLHPDAPISMNCREYILGWLTGRDIGQGTTWHSSFELTSANLPNFERKALAIINEHLLSIRLRALNATLIDTTWLATQLENGGSSTVSWGLNWRDQLAGRDTDSLVIDPVRNPVVEIAGPAIESQFKDLPV